MNAGPALDWTAVEGRLRPFIASRVRSPADADDVLQTVLLRVYERSATLRDGARLDAWLRSVTRNAITDHFRAGQKAPDLPDKMPEPAPEPIDDPLHPLMAQVMGGMVDLLAPKYRDALRWTELEGLTQKAAAERAGISLSGMKSRVQRARVQLVEMLHACCAIELDRRGRIIECEPRIDDCACTVLDQ